MVRRQMPESIGMGQTAVFHERCETVPLSPSRPLLIVDADEVLFLFADGFDRFLGERGLYLDFSSYMLYGNVRRKSDGAPLPDEHVNQLLDEFREIFDSLDPVEGALEAIADLAPLLDIVVLSNMTEAQVPLRLKNFSLHGLALPLMINSGLKGPAVQALAARGGRPAFFVDDITRHHASVAEAAPDVIRIHLIGDARFRPTVPASRHVSFRAETWTDAADFIRTRLAP
jgi:hypothetical protein